MKYQIIAIVLCFLSCFARSQKEEHNMSDEKKSQKQTYYANQKVKEKQFPEAEYNYKKAISSNQKNATAKYNLGTTYLKNKKYGESYYTLMEAAKSATTKKEKHNIYHNMGNAFMAKKDYENAMIAYKKALIEDPKDNKTRYNFALAKELLKNRPKNNNKKDEDKKDKSKKNKSKKKKDKKDKDKKEKGKKGEDKKNNKKSKAQLKPQQIKGILEAVDKKEKKAQEKVNLKKMKGTPIKQDKDW